MTDMLTTSPSRAGLYYIQKFKSEAGFGASRQSKALPRFADELFDFLVGEFVGHRE